MKRINDPIYGLIEISDIESQIIDTPLFQRLRYIRQLSLAEFVYPTATHNRFSHSLGVFHITDKIGKILQKSNNKFMSNYYIDNLKMAALLHDIGHLPFSHALEFSEKEDVWNKLPSFLKLSHEELGVYQIKNSYLKNIIESADDCYDIDLICNLIQGIDIADNAILNRIINWELDADRLDYMLRDTYFTGVKFGSIDLDYMISNYEIYKNEKLVVNKKASRSIENFLIARFSLYDRVYTHKNISYFNFFLKNVTSLLIENGLFPLFKNDLTFDEIILTEERSELIYELTDFSLYDKLLQYYYRQRNLKEKNKSILSNLNSVLFRKKNHNIFKYQKITNQKSGIIELVDDKILTLIDSLNEEYKNQIYLDNPKNRFTKYQSVFYSSMGIDQEKINEIKEQELKSIWITSDNGNPQLFYEWTGTYFRELVSFKNIKYLIYIEKNKEKLAEKYRSIENDIKKQINKL